MKILITGANGYLGQGVVKSLINDGYDVLAVDFKTDFVDKRAERINCDLFSIKNPFVYFEKPDVLLHMAWRDGFVHYSDSHIEDIPKHYKFIKEMAEGGVKQIAVMGSMHEVGFYEGCINENTICHPETPYGIGKNTLLKLTQMICKKKNIVFQWLRGYYIVGNSEFGCSIFSKITKAVKDGKKEFPFTSGQNQYDFIDYFEFCEQVSSVVGQNSINGIIELCSGKPEKLAERVERFIKENEYDLKLVYGAFPDREYDSKAVWGNDKKICEIMANKLFH